MSNVHPIRPDVEIDYGKGFDPAPLVEMFERFIAMARTGEIREACVVAGRVGDAAPGYEHISECPWRVVGYLHYVATDITAGQAFGDDFEDGPDDDPSGGLPMPVAVGQFRD